MSVKSKDALGADKLYLDDSAVLTVLASAPAANSFRPPYAGTDKAIPGTLNEIDWSVFRSLAKVANAPALTHFDGKFNQVMIDIIGQWPNSNLKVSNASPAYGRDIAYEIGDAVLSLNLNYTQAQKTPILIKLIQRGIDTYGLAKAGMVWKPNGGHNVGRKLALLVAGKALHHAGMLEWADGRKHLIFQEDMQHWYIDSTDVSTPRFYPESKPYTNAMIGTPEWASNPIDERNRTGSEWDKAYRFVNGSANTGLVLAAQLMGLRDEWNWEPLFRYINERYWPQEGVTPVAAVSIPVFHRNMWKAYRNSAPSDIDPDNTSTVGIWQNLGFAAQSGAFTVSFDMVPSQAAMDAVAGISAGAADQATDLAASVRFAPTGVVQAANGATFGAQGTIRYSAGVRYNVVMKIDPTTDRYSVDVTPQGGTAVTIAQNYSFRSERTGTTGFNNVGFMATTGAQAVLNINVVPTAPTQTPTPGAAAIRINAGGGTYVDKAGNRWAADYGFTSGLTDNTAVAIAGTNDDELFQTERFDNLRSSRSLSYELPVANGAYTVRLHFAEMFAKKAKARVFDVKMENKLVIDNLDIFTRVGANTALIISTSVTVTDGKLNLDFINGVANARVSAIEVVPVK